MVAAAAWVIWKFNGKWITGEGETSINKHTNTHARTCIYAYTDTFPHMSIHVYLYICMHVYMCRSVTSLQILVEYCHFTILPLHLHLCAYLCVFSISSSCSYASFIQLNMYIRTCRICSRQNEVRRIAFVPTYTLKHTRK